MSELSHISDEIDKTRIAFIKATTISNQTKIIEIFTIHVLPYRDRIEACDEEYFLSNNDKLEEKYNNDKNIITNIFKFKNIWLTLNDINKKKVTKFLTILCTYSAHYFKLKFGEAETNDELIN